MVAVKPGESFRRAKLAFQVKGSVPRGRVEALTTERRIERVIADLSPAVVAMVQSPPPASSWVEGALLAELDDVVYDVYGEKVLAHIAQLTIKNSLAPLMRSVIEGSIRLFGTSPRTLLSRLGAMSASTVRGISFEWHDLDSRGGELVVTYDDSRDVPRSAFVAVSAGLVNVLELSGVNGTVVLGDRTELGARNRAPFVCRW